MRPHWELRRGSFRWWMRGKAGRSQWPLFVQRRGMPALEQGFHLQENTYYQKAAFTFPELSTLELDFIQLRERGKELVPQPLCLMCGPHVTGDVEAGWG